MKTSTIYAAIWAVRADCAGLTNLTSLKQAYVALHELMQKHSVFCCSHVLSHHRDLKTAPGGSKLVSTTTVDVSFEFLASDGSSVSSRTVGVHVDEEPTLTNHALFAATTNALLSVFALTADGVATSPESAPIKNPVANLLEQHGQLGLQTADQIKPKAATLTVPKHPTKLALAEDAKALLDWQNKIVELSDENPGDWDEHRNVLKKLRGMTDDQKIDQFNKLVEQAGDVGVGYNEKRRAFYLLEPVSEPAQ